MMDDDGLTSQERLAAKRLGRFVVVASDKDSKAVLRVRLPCFIDYARMCDAFNRARVDAINRRTAMLALQAECSKRGDRDSARFFKEEAADAMKEQRAASLFLGYHSGDPPKDSPWRDLDEWPVELGPQLSRVAGFAELMTDGAGL